MLSELLQKRGKWEICAGGWGKIRMIVICHHIEIKINTIKLWRDSEEWKRINTFVLATCGECKEC